MLLDDPIVKRWVERIYIGMDEKLENIVPRLYPTDTTNQGKNFYKNVDLASVSSLVAGWAIKPLLNFAYMGTHLVRRIVNDAISICN
jgi:hypothetical protein